MFKVEPARDRMSAAAFLTAEWRHLVMLNYEADPRLLAPLVPRGVELDSWGGMHFVSVVGFLFLNTRLLGVPVPFHRNFEEVNLRFYVRRRAPEGWRRGVVFIREFVPRAAIASIARLVYNEPYLALPMRHTLTQGVALSACYKWRTGGRWHQLSATTRGALQPTAPGSQEEFITEHYWGYTAQRDGSTVEYQVEHPRWPAWQVAECALDCDVAALYGPQFTACLGARPCSAFVAEGSPVTVRRGQRI